MNPRIPPPAAARLATIDLALVRRLEAAALHGWPATVQRTTPGGWVLRSTPGLDRGRSNHALTPCRPVTPAELSAGLQAVQAFAAQHGIRPGIQVSPLGLHDRTERALEELGWERGRPARVLARTGAVIDPDLPVGKIEHSGGYRQTDHADPAWLNAWARCEPGRDVEAHARTVLHALAGRARFGRIDDAAVGIAVPWEGTLGLYCVAVDPRYRRRGLGREITTMLAADHAGATVFLQVEADNAPANALYEELGLRETHRYVHRTAPR